MSVFTNSVINRILFFFKKGGVQVMMGFFCCVFQGLICYKPVNQDSCFLRNMEASDYKNVHSLLRESTHEVKDGDISTREN